MAAAQSLREQEARLSEAVSVFTLEGSAPAGPQPANRIRHDARVVPLLALA